MSKPKNYIYVANQMVCTITADSSDEAEATLAEYVKTTNDFRLEEVRDL